MEAVFEHYEGDRAPVRPVRPVREPDHASRCLLCPWAWRRFRARSRLAETFEVRASSVSLIAGGAGEEPPQNRAKQPGQDCRQSRAAHHLHHAGPETDERPLSPGMSLTGSRRALQGRHPGFRTFSGH